MVKGWNSEEGNCILDYVLIIIPVFHCSNISVFECNS